MNLKLLGIIAISSTILFSGCATFDKYQDKAEEQILIYLRENGTEKTDKYIDKLVVEEKITTYQADKLKEIIHRALSEIEKALAERIEPSKSEENN